MGNTIWTQERIFDAFSEWAEINGVLPSSTEWKHARSRHHPTSQTVREKFGSWRQAIASYREVHPDVPAREFEWSRDRILDAFRAWVDEHGSAPNSKNATSKNQMPSSTTVGKYFGSWNAALREIGVVPLPPGVSRLQVNRYKPMPRDR